MSIIHSNPLLPIANEVWGKVIFLHLSVILFTGGCLLLGGVCSRGGLLQGVPGPGRGVCSGGGGCLVECILVKANNWIPKSYVTMTSERCLLWHCVTFCTKGHSIHNKYVICKETSTLTETETDTYTNINGLCRIVWWCSYYIETSVLLNTVAILSISISLSVSISVKVNTP